MHHMQLPHGQVFQLSRRVAAKRDGQAAADRAIDGTLMAFVLGSMLPIMQPLPSIPIPRCPHVSLPISF
jgi:hypothetical protein